MIRTSPTLPEGHGQVVERPDYAEWAALVTHNREAASEWDFRVGGIHAHEMSRLARRDIVSTGEDFSARLGVSVRPAGDAQSPIVATGHQPDLYHPGVWVKDFLLERLANELGATAVDIVVDSDGFDAIGVSAPCMRPGVLRCRQYLAIGGPSQSFAFSGVPDSRELGDFCSAADSMLASLPAPAVRRHFSAFCDCLTSAADDADNLAELVTIARRRYEAPAGTGYLEAPLTRVVRTESFTRFLVEIALDANRFAQDYNAELEQYRTLTRTRSAAQPFPNLALDHGRVELPMWHLGPSRRHTVWAEPMSRGRVRLSADGQTIADLPAHPDEAVAVLRAASPLIAPKALALTLFVRLFACDLFVHGVGGGRYDRVTDGVIGRYFGVEPPAFVVASMTMYLPLGARIVGAEDVSAAKERLNRLEHNPDALLGEVEFDSADERQRALALAEEKRSLVEAIARPDADRKALGLRIREVNRELADVLAPLREVYAEELAALEEQLRASEILTDRTYPFCFWDPREIADKVW